MRSDSYQWPLCPALLPNIDQNSDLTTKVVRSEVVKIKVLSNSVNKPQEKL